MGKEGEEDRRGGEGGSEGDHRRHELETRGDVRGTRTEDWDGSRELLN